MKFLRSLFAGLALAILTSGSALAQCGTTAPANKFCGNDTSSSALATWRSIPPTALSAIAGGTVLGNRTGSSAVPTPVTNPVLGIPGSSTGEVGLAGSTSGTTILRAQAAAGSAVNLLPTSAGTLVSTASSPLAINSTTGQISVTGLAGGVLAGAAPAFTATPVLGVPGASQGSLGFAGATSGTVTVQAQATAGTATLTLPNASGTAAVDATSPLVLSATTGMLTCPTCVTSSGGGAITGTAPISVSGAGVVSINAPYTTLTASNGGIVYSGATNLAILAGTATARQMLQSGASAAPEWSTATWPATTTANQILYSSSANTVGEITTTSGGILNTNGSSVPSVTRTPVLGVAGTAVGSIGFQNLTSGTVTLQPVTGALGTVTINIPAAAGTMAVSAVAPITLSAAGAIGITSSALTKTDDTNVTLTLGGTPSSALLAATSLTLGWTGQLGLTRGGTNASLTASNGGIIYSTASAMAVLAGTATANQHLASGSSGAPSWTTATFPATTAAGTVLASASANAVTATATPTLGANGGTGGQITLNGSTSGSAAIRVAAAAGSTTFQLPVGNGASGQVLSTDGAGNTSWIASGGTGTVTNVGTAGLATGGPITTTGTVTVTAATKSDQQTGTSTTTVVTPEQQQQHASAAKAWVNFAGASGAINASYNVTSVSRSGAGIYAVNFTTAFANTNYVCVGTAEDTSTNEFIKTGTSGKTTSSLPVLALNSFAGTADPAAINIVCFGTQ